MVDRGLRLTVPAGLSDAVWIWLLDAGWRVEAHRPDRRSYQDVARSEVEQLVNSDPTLRRRLLDYGDGVWVLADIDFPCSRRVPADAADAATDLGQMRFLKPSQLQIDSAPGTARRS